MPSYKRGRLNEDVKREMTAILREVKDPRVGGMISVIAVDVASDLSVAKIYLSSLEGLEAMRESLKGLKSASGFIRSQLATRLGLRKAPELRFIADDGIERSAHIAQLLQDTHKGEHHDDT